MDATNVASSKSGTASATESTSAASASKSTAASVTKPAMAKNAASSSGTSQLETEKAVLQQVIDEVHINSKAMETNAANKIDKEKGKIARKKAKELWDRITSAHDTINKIIGEDKTKEAEKNTVK
jgi:hypothetical protein